GNQNVKVVEVDYDPTANYNLGHIPGSALIDWRKDINDPVARDIVSKDGLEALLGRLGISNEDQIVLYGDFNNWFAAFAFWVFKYYGVDNVVLLNGGRRKWIDEDGTFKTPEQLKALYEPKGVTPDKEVIAYCRIGERSSHTWFVLKYLLGYPNVRNYDGSWTEWGNLVRTPIEKP